jgi:hypothetical protein
VLAPEGTRVAGQQRVPHSPLSSSEAQPTAGSADCVASATPRLRASERANRAPITLSDPDESSLRLTLGRSLRLSGEQSVAVDDSGREVDEFAVIDS